MFRNLLVQRLFAKAFGRRLDLSHCELTAPYLRTLMHHDPDRFRGLSTLSVANNEIDDPGALIEIIDLAGGSLQEINASGNPLIGRDTIAISHFVMEERHPGRLREGLMGNSATTSKLNKSAEAKTTLRRSCRIVADATNRTARVDDGPIVHLSEPECLLLEALIKADGGIVHKDKVDGMDDYADKMRKTKKNLNTKLKIGWIDGKTSPTGGMYLVEDAFGPVPE